MHFAALPPEVNSGRMYAGPGAGPMLAAATAWDELANELQTTAAAAAPQVAWLNSAAAQANQTGDQAKAAAAAYESAYAMTVPPPVIEANRAQLNSLVATNLLGQNAPAIAATEVAYGEMWAQDVAAMYSYAGESQAAAQVTPFTPPQQTTNQGGLTAQSASATQAAATPAGGAQAALSNSPALSAVPSALQALTTTSALGAFSDFANPYDLASLGSGLLGNGVGLIGMSGATGFISEVEHKVTKPMVGVDAVSPAESADRAGAPMPRQPETAQTVSAGMGRASSLGRMSVPEGWSSAAPEVRLVGLQSPNTGSLPPNPASPGTVGGMPLFGGTPLMALPGRGASDSRDRRAADKSDVPRGQMRAAAPNAPVAQPPNPSGGRAADSVAEIREVTELLSRLAALRDSGALTDQEFSEQKQRLLGG